MNIFSTRKPRQFQRQPYFSDPRKEALEARIRKVKREMGLLEEDTYNPEDSIRGSFAQGTRHLRRRQESGEPSASKRNVKVGLWIIILAGVLYFILK